MTKLLIKGGTVVNAHETRKADVLCDSESGKIVCVAADIDGKEADEVIDATGKLILPGLIDAHTHLEMPFMGTTTIDTWTTGSQAAVAGGTTMVIDFITPRKGQPLSEGFERYRKMAEPAVCNYSFHMMVTEWRDSTADEMKEMVEAGINSFKMFMAYKNAIMVDDETLIKSFGVCQELGALPMVHAENGEIVFYNQQRLFNEGTRGPVGHPMSRDAYCEGEACERACTFAQQLDCPLMIVHNTCLPAIRAIERARQAGFKVFGEATSVHLTLDESNYYSKDPLFAACHVLSPPLRGREHVEGCWNAITSGVLDYIITDHCTFNKKQKSTGLEDFRKIPNGMGGIEERGPIMWTLGVNTGRFTKERFVEVCSTKIAKIYNLYPQKGVIQEGSDADLAIWDPEATHTFSAETQFSANDFSGYEGFECKGMPIVTLVNGRVVFKDRKIQVEGGGKYHPRKPFAPIVYEGGYKHHKAVLDKKADVYTNPGPN